MTGFFGAESAMIDIWVKSKLTTGEGATQLNALFASLSTRVYKDLGEAEAVYPFIVFQVQSPPEVLRGVGSEEVMVDTIYIVKATAQGVDDGPLAPVASAIRDILVSNNGESITGGIGTVFTCRYERQFQMSSAEQGSQFRHLGGAFRIQARAA